MKTSAPLSEFARYAYAPAMLLGMNGLGIGLIAAGHPWLAAVVVLPAAIAASFAVERLIPYARAWNRSQGDAGRDMWHAAVNETANLVTLAVLPLTAGCFVVRDLWPLHWPFALQMIAALLVLDTGIGLAHYLSHRVHVLWRFHAVHHSVKRMYGFNGLMKHPVHQAIEMLAGSAPLLLFGLPVEVAAALVLCTAVQLLLQHSNADYRLGPLKFLLATNEVHRFHHLKKAGEGDVNFGLFTTLVDHGLGTFHYDARRRFTSDDLGIGDRPDYPSRYLAQLREPFRAAP